jgi:hypothetical protein
MRQAVSSDQSKAGNEQASSSVSGTILHPMQLKVDGSPRQRAQQGRLTQLRNASMATTPNGLPPKLRTGIEALSGMDMGHVAVHRNSAKPAQLNALAYAQGNEIHLAPGQEQHLPHEAWHVVQQAQGRVKPTKQLKGVVSINDDKDLEREADVMGARALQMPSPAPEATEPAGQRVTPLQRKSETQLQRRRIPDASVQLKPIPVVSLGVTHLVHEENNSIFEGYEVGRIGEIEPGEKLVVDDEDIIVSRRGIHAADSPELHEQYRMGEQIYDWYRVLGVKEATVGGEKLYLREEMFARDDERNLESESEDGNREDNILCDPYGDGEEEEGILLGPETIHEFAGCELEIDGTTRTFDKRAAVNPKDAKIGDTVTVRLYRDNFTGVLKKIDRLEKTLLKVRLKGSGEMLVEPGRVKRAEAQAIKRQSHATITHYTRQKGPHGGEFVSPGGPIDITSHALGAGIYGFHTVSETVEKYAQERNLKPMTVTFANPFVVQDQGHGAKLMRFSKLLAQTAHDLNQFFVKSTVLSMPLIQGLLLNHRNYPQLASLLTELLARAGQGHAPTNALGTALLEFFRTYRNPDSLYVEQVGTILFKQMGFGGIAGSPDTGIDGLTTGNVAFVTDFVTTKIKTRTGTTHTYVT